MKEKIIGFFSLFGSSATLLCCALPAMISIIAGGAAVGSLVSAFPWLIPISKHKAWIFVFGGVMLFINGFFVLRPKGRLACSITGGKGCEVASNFSKGMFYFSLLLYFIGTFFAYLYVPLMRFIGK